MLRRLLLALLMLALIPASIAAAAIRADDPAQSSAPTTAPIAADPTLPKLIRHAPLLRRPAGTERALIRQIVRLQRDTWRWQRLMGVRTTGAGSRSLANASLETLVAVRDKWRRFATRARRRAAHPPHERGWLCIHRYEASWTDGGAPYYGGLQMDWGFMRHYGGDLLRRKGTADHWTPVEQMWVAERAFRSGRGYYAWPNTARYCGLI
jgi:hypothetical protein